MRRAHRPFPRTPSLSNLRTTDTEGRTLDGGSCTVAADAGAGAVPPRAWFVALRVQFDAGGGADRHRKYFIDESCMSDPDPASAESAFLAISSRFNAQITALRLFAEHLGPIADEQDQKYHKPFLDRIIELTGSSPSAAEGNTSNWSISIEVGTRPDQPDSGTEVGKSRNTKTIEDPATVVEIVGMAQEWQRKATRHGVILRNGALVLAVSYLDVLVADLAREFYTRFPGVLTSEERTISFADLITLGSIEAAREQVLSREIDSLLRQNFDQQLDFFRKKLKVHLSALDPHRDRLIESIQRRHLLVHAGGIVSKQYIERVSPDLLKEFEVQLGKPVRVSPKYLRRAIDRVNLTGIVLIQQCWRKWLPAEGAEADSLLSDNLFDSIKDGRFVAAQHIGEFARTLELGADSTRRNLLLNLAQAYKWDGQPAKTEEILKEADWSSCGLRYTLAIAALRDEGDKFFGIVDRALAAEELQAEHLRSWPIFQAMRQDPRFIKYAEPPSAGPSKVDSDDLAGDSNG
jgi:hypothetical protein